METKHPMESHKSRLLEWLRGHLIVVDPSAMQELRQGLKQTADRKKMHRKMHQNGSDWEVRQEGKNPMLNVTDELDMLCVVHPLTEVETDRKAKLIIDHRSEFPSKLRHAIEQAAESDYDSTSFLMEVYEAVKVFFLGRNTDIISENRPRLLPEEWLELDRSVDTEDQVEIAIRFFPLVLTEYLHSSLAVLSPIQLLLAEERTVSFVPLFAKLLTEAGNFLQRQFVVKHGMRNILELLMTNCFPKIVFGCEVSESFDNESLAVLIRLRDMGLVENEEVKLLITALMAYALESHDLKRESKFIEARLRLLVGWNPSILEKGRRPLLHTVYGEALCNDCNETLLLGMFETLSELGMTHYPKELGFIFHKWGGISPLESFSSALGTARVTEIVNERLSITFGSNPNTISSMFIEAATNDKIHLDGLYRLVGLNPILCSSEYAS